MTIVEMLFYTKYSLTSAQGAPETALGYFSLVSHAAQAHAMGLAERGPCLTEAKADSLYLLSWILTAVPT